MDNPQIEYDEVKREITITGEAPVIYKGSVDERIETLQREISEIESEQLAQNETKARKQAELSTLTEMINQ